MQILSFDTSASDLQIAALKDGKILLAKKLSPKANARQEAASQLMPAIETLLSELSWKKQEIDILVVGIGPGSFTGVRVAVITARSLGQALNLAVYPVSSLEALAFNLPRPCAIVLNAGAGSLYFAAYGKDLEKPEESQLSAPLCATAEELSDRIAQFEEVFLDESLPESLLTSKQKRLKLAPDINQASAAATLAFERLKQAKQLLSRDSLSKAYPWDNVLPLYLRSPSVTLKAKDGSSNKTTAS
ncbi:MAG: tRNA (adenosine(37)-N6)-threonylcarbamoyltransferase complex dimerization subunit type 1 TsaB [Candidatus Obscuribacterales bacterium]|nr:tRNA (adenosine(37)-N6)-threonylcarbamoyltransferase complex dimerization subunit type 1 TsaB [Candidatus Obscuribacterales bacterium]